MKQKITATYTIGDQVGFVSTPSLPSSLYISIKWYDFNVLMYEYSGKLVDTIKASRHAILGAASDKMVINSKQEDELEEWLMYGCTT
jgi:hypothetical protein